MVVLLVVMMILTIGAVMMWWPEWGAAEPPAAEDGAAAAASRPVPTTLEGALVAQLLSGKITPGQYGTAMAGLAERDDRRHPVVVPGDDGPGRPV